MFNYRSIFGETPRPARIKASPRAPWLAVGVVCFGAFMGQLDASIVTLTFRPMERQFAAPLAGVQWVSLAYLLVLVALVTPVGRLADNVGRKLIYIYGFVVFTLASLACGFAPTLTVLIGFRLVQAVGAAMLQSNSVALVTTSVPASKMRLGLSIQAGAQSIGLAAGPTLGGLLTQTVGWRAVYFINVPVGIVAIVAARYLLPRTQHLSRDDRFDWIGAALLGTATTALLLALSIVSGLPAPGWAAVLMGVLAVAATVAFAVRQLRARFPLIPAPLLRSVRLGLALTGAFLGYLVLFGPLVLVPQILGGHGSALRAGLILSALPVGFGVAALTAERVLPSSWPNRTRGAFGAAISVAALVLLIFFSSSLLAIILLLGLTGIGLGAFVPANNAVIMRSGTSGTAAVLGGLVNMARGIGTTFGIALVTLTLHLTSKGSGGLAFGLLAVGAACAVVVALIIKPLKPGQVPDFADPQTLAEHSSAFG